MNKIGDKISDYWLHEISGRITAFQCAFAWTPSVLWMPRDHELAFLIGHKIWGIAVKASDFFLPYLDIE